jgi:AraC family transcriptional activator of pobA
MDQTIPAYSLKQNSREGHSLIEVAHLGRGISPEPGFLIPHRKDYYLFVFVKNGSSRHWVDFIPYTLTPDTLYFTTPHQVHLKEDLRPAEGMALRFTEEFLRLEDIRSLMDLPIIQNPANGHVLKLAPEDVRFCEDAFLRLIAEFNSDGAWKNRMLAALLQQLLVYTSRVYQEQYGEGVTPNPMLRAFQTLLNLHFRELHAVADYAGLLHLSADHLNEVVRRHSGKTALAHIHERILVEVKRLLLHTERSVKEIAGELGFADAAYFNRWFRRMEETTPVLYRESIREIYR